MIANGWHLFLHLCLAAKNEKELDHLFELFFTAEERDSLTTRAKIIQALLAKEKPQRQIAEELQVSIAKITRGSNELKRITPVLRDYLATHLLTFSRSKTRTSRR